jgi:hypothetical protein
MKNADIIWITTKFNFRSENPINFPLADFCQETSDETDMGKTEETRSFSTQIWI